MMKRKTKIFLLLILTIIILFFIFTKINIRETFLIIMGSDKFYSLFILLIMIIMPIIRSYRWFIVLSEQKNVPFKKCLICTFSSLAFLFVPGRLGDFSKSYYLRKEMSALHSAGTIITERIIDMFALIFLVALSFIFKFEKRLFYIYLSAAVILIFLIILARLWNFKVINKKIGLVFKSLKEISIKTSFKVFLISLLFWLISVLQVYFIFRSVYIDINLANVFIGIPIVIFIGLIPVTLGGVGTRDLAFLAVFGNQFPSVKIIAVGVLFTFYRYILPSIMGLVFNKSNLK